MLLAGPPSRSSFADKRLVLARSSTRLERSLTSSTIQEKLKEREKEDADRSRSHRDDHKSSSRRRGSSAHRERAESEETSVKRAASHEVGGEDERRSKIAKVEKQEGGEPFSAQEVEMMDVTTAAEVRDFAASSRNALTDPISLFFQPDEPEEGEI